jgi:hypothetical protein
MALQLRVKAAFLRSKRSCERSPDFAKIGVRIIDGPAQQVLCMENPEVVVKTWMLVDIRNASEPSVRCVAMQTLSAGSRMGFVALIAEGIGSKGASSQSRSKAG